MAKALWFIAANDNLPEEDWSWELLMMLAHMTDEDWQMYMSERWAV